MSEHLRRRAAAVAAALSLTLCAGIAVAWNREAPAQRRLASADAGGEAPARIAPAPPPDAPAPLPSPTPTPTPPVSPPPPEPAQARLAAFDSCAGALAWYRETALRLVTPYGLPGGHGDVMAEPVADAAPAAGRAGDDAATGGGQEGGAQPPVVESGTNVQVAGVDEPDVAKLASGILVTVVGASAHVVDLRTTPPSLRATLALPDGWDHQLLLRGARLLVTTNGAPPHPSAPPSGDERFVPAPQRERTTVLSAFDLADPSAPRALGELRLDGALVSAREHGGLVRLVLRSAPAPVFVAPARGTPEHERAALERNREIARSSTLENWLPAAAATAPGRRPVRTPMAACDGLLRVARPDRLETVTVATLDLAAPTALRGSASAIGAGETVYATADRVYAAHTVAGPAPATAIHVFDTRRPDAPRHVADGIVPGHLLNQWALSEHEGHLRVATTEQGPDGDTSSGVRVLSLGDGLLREVGAVGGLGRGERIYAVRYLGDTAYVVTFRQVDPLYVVDLSDPVRPRVSGELKIPGFSRYLHPVGDGLLVGIGQDADDDGRARGLQLSVFDVRDPASPRRVSQVAFGPRAHSEAEHDHRAVLWWAPLRRLVVPMVRWSDGPEGDGARFGSEEPGAPPFVGAVSVAVDGAGNAWEAARSDTGTGEGNGDGVRRAFARGDSVVLVGDGGVIVAGMDRMEERSRLRFPRTDTP